MSETMTDLRDDPILQKRWINHNQLAKLLGCHRTTLYEWIEVGEVPPPHRPKHRRRDGVIVDGRPRWPQAVVVRMLVERGAIEVHS